MCINYISTSRVLAEGVFDTLFETDHEWRDEIYRDYAAPFIILNSDGERHGLVGTYGMRPKNKIREDQEDFNTMNARDDWLTRRYNYKDYWAKGNLCLVPMTWFVEPNWEKGRNEWWRIGMADRQPFCVAGLWRDWKEADGTTTFSFTQITVNADEHPLMRRFHRPGEEKRSLVIVPPDAYDDWLSCKDPERAREFLRLYPSELMHAEPNTKPKLVTQGELF